MYTDIQIQQAQATVEAKITTEAYSAYLKKLYGLRNYCSCAELKCLLLFRFALSGWDNRPGGVNDYSVGGLTNIIKRINAL